MSEDALRAARELAAGLDPRAAALRCGVAFEDGEPRTTGTFSIPFLGGVERVTFPGFEFTSDTKLPPHVRALLVYYLAGCTASEPTGAWRSFADLPNGLIYSSAFQGYTGNALVRRLGGMSLGLAEAVTTLGGRPLAREELATNADAAWVVPVLPRVPVVVLWWESDEEFPARAELLFDATATHHLPIDGCAVAGSWLTTRLADEVERNRA